MRAMSNASRLAAYLEAEAAVLKGQSYSYQGRTLTRTNLVEIRKGIAELQRAVNAETARASGVESRWAVADFSGGTT